MSADLHPAPSAGATEAADPVRTLLANGPREDPAGEAFEALQWATWNGRMLLPEELDTLLALAGRVNGPRVLAEAWFGDVLSFDALSGVVGSVWSTAEYPDVSLDRDEWREMFAAAGFTVDGERAELPEGPVELWRGSVPDRRDDWSWSTEREIAEKYARGKFRRPPGRLYRVLAPSSALLCFNSGRGESEYVVDVEGLDVVEVAAFDGA
ncbi:hypothetical protein ACIPRL_07895 [Streptomyces sp. NPDC090085]|uniref:hypothetical protein n=1 Tax=Streptomyces sp. NPDC090085 TaxID=3365943 RepID=UPI003805670C